MPIDRRKPNSAQFQVRPSVVERRHSIGGSSVNGRGFNPSLNFNNGSSRTGNSTIKISPKTSKVASSRGLADQKSYDIERQPSSYRSVVDNRSSRAVNGNSTIKISPKTSKVASSRGLADQKSFNIERQPSSYRSVVDNRSSRAVNSQHAKPYIISVFPPTHPRASIPVGACVPGDRSGQLYRINRTLEHNYNPDLHNFELDKPRLNPCCQPVFNMRSVFSPDPSHGTSTGRCGLGPGESVQLQVLGDLQDVGISKVNCNIGSVDVLKDCRTLPDVPAPAAHLMPNNAECSCPIKSILKLRQQQQQQQQQRHNVNISRQQREYEYQPVQCRNESQEMEEDVQMRLFFGCVGHFMNYSSYIGVFLTVFTALVWYMCINSLGKYSVIFGIVLMSFLLAFRAKRLLQFLER